MDVGRVDAAADAAGLGMLGEEDADTFTLGEDGGDASTLLVEATTVTQTRPPGELTSLSVPGGGDIAVRLGADPLDLKHGKSLQLGVTIKTPSTTVHELAPEWGFLPPSITNPSLEVPDKLLAPVPYVGPASIAPTWRHDQDALDHEPQP